MGGEIHDQATAPSSGWLHPPGWYPDPNGLAQVRWWDGYRWTAEVTPSEDATASVRGSPLAASSQPATPMPYSADGLRRWDGTAWVRVKRWDGSAWVDVKSDLRRALRRGLVVLALAAVVVLAIEWIGRLVDAQVCAGLPPTDYQDCVNSNAAVAGWFVGPILMVLIIGLVAYLATHPIVTPAERAGRVVGDCVNNGTMSPDDAQGACQQWARRSATSQKRFIRGYTGMGAHPWQ